MAVQTFDQVAKTNNRLIRRGRRGVMLLKKYDPATEAPTQAWTEAGGLMIPAGFESSGLLKKDDGVEWEKDLEVTESESVGFGDATRIDLEKEETTFSYTAQESKRINIELYQGRDLSSVTTDSEGNVYWDAPPVPSMQEWHVLQLFADGVGANAIYFMRYVPLARVTDIASQKFATNEDVEWGVTLKGVTDPNVGTAVREIWGGPGLPHEAMGFQPPAGA